MIERITALVVALGWPVVTISIVLILRSDIRALIHGTRLRSAKMPGVRFDFVNEMTKMKNLQHCVEKEFRFAKGDGRVGGPRPEANRQLMKLGLTPSPTQFDLDRYKEMAATNPMVAMAALKDEIAIMAANLLRFRHVPFSNHDTVEKKLRLLFSSRAINNHQFLLGRAILSTTRAATARGKVSKKVAVEMIDSSRPLFTEFIAWLENDPAISKRGARSPKSEAFNEATD